MAATLEATKVLPKSAIDRTIDLINQNKIKDPISKYLTHRIVQLSPSPENIIKSNKVALSSLRQADKILYKKLKDISFEWKTKKIQFAQRYRTIPQIRRVIKKVCHLCGEDTGLSKKMIIKFNKRFRSLLGDADSKSLEIRLIARYWSVMTDAERYEIIVHETCHILADRKHGTNIRPHGREWRAMMGRAGLKPETLIDIHTKPADGSIICPKGHKGLYSRNYIRQLVQNQIPLALCSKKGFQEYYIPEDGECFASDAIRTGILHGLIII